MRRSVWSYVAFSILMVLYPTIFYMFATTDSAKRVLVIGDFSADGFGDQIWKGIENAHLSTSQADRLVLEKINISHIVSDQEPYKTRNILHLVLRQLGNGPVLAIIAATNSAHTKPILKVAQSFNILILLTVATTDSLLEKDSGGWSANTVRLLPNDTEQASSISRWIEEHHKNKESKGSSTKTKILIAYDSGVYGQFLFQQVKGRLENAQLSVIGWRLSPNYRSVEILKDAQAFQASMVLFLGYYQDAKDLVDNAQTIGFSQPILLSDGAFSPSITGWKIKDVTVYMSQPVNPQMKNLENLGGFSVYGSDAYVLLKMARYETGNYIDGGETGFGVNGVNNEKGVITRLKRLPEVFSGDVSAERKRWIADYKFKEESGGQNTAAKFCIVQIAPSPSAP